METFEDFLKALQQLTTAKPVANLAPYDGPTTNMLPPDWKPLPGQVPMGSPGADGAPQLELGKLVPDYGGAFDPAVGAMGEKGGQDLIKTAGAFQPMTLSGARPQPVDVGRLPGAPQSMLGGSDRGGNMHTMLAGLLAKRPGGPHAPRPRPMAAAQPQHGAFAPPARPGATNGVLL